jgi:hypothetical protein
MDQQSQTPGKGKRPENQQNGFCFHFFPGNDKTVWD